MERAIVERADNVAGGKGYITKKYILSGDKLPSNCRMYAEVTLTPGCSIGYHPHNGESETYYIISGNGEYNDNGNMCKVQVGDITYTPSGKAHGIENTGDTDLVFMAIILKD